MKTSLSILAGTLLVLTACDKEPEPPQSPSYPQVYEFASSGNLGATQVFTKNAIINAPGHYTVDSVNGYATTKMAENNSDLAGEQWIFLNDHQITGNGETVEYVTSGQYVVVDNLLTMKKEDSKLTLFGYCSSEARNSSNEFFVQYDWFLEQGQTLQSAVQDSLVVGDTAAAKTFQIIFNRK